jgi:hypothetical protein
MERMNRNLFNDYYFIFRSLFINPFAIADYDNKWNGFSNQTSGLSTASEILNPPIPGEPCSDIASFQARVNAFAKPYGLGVVKRAGSERKIKN